MERQGSLTLTVDNNKATRSLVYDIPLRTRFPSLNVSIDELNTVYQQDKEAAFAEISENYFTIKTNRYGPSIEASVIVDSISARSKQALLIFAPFSDVAPRSSASVIAEYVNNPEPSFLDINRAQPHSWSQAIKSGTIHDLLQAEGYPMPVITIFGPLPMTAFSAKELIDYSKGDFTRDSKIALSAFNHVQDMLHGPSSETQLDVRHFYGASIGASHAIASAVALAPRNDMLVGSVTAQELILGPKHILDLLKRFTIKGSVGNPSHEKLSQYAPKIEEVSMRRQVDQHKNELLSHLQMLNGMTKVLYLNGLTNPEPIINDVRTIARNGIPITVANGDNSGLSYQTYHFLKGILGKNNIIRVRGVSGQKAEHLINENVVTSAAIALAGIDRAFR